MKVLHVTTHMNIGGIGNYILSLSGALKDYGVNVLVASSGGNLVYELERRGIPHMKLKMDTKFEFSPKVFSSAITLCRAIREEKVDIIHAHSRVSQVAAHFASLGASVPYVTTCHGFFKKRLRRIFDTWGQKTVAISDAVKSHLIEDLHVKGDRIELIYNGVDVGQFSKDYSRDKIEAEKKILGLKGGPVVGTIGRLSSVKGQKFLIQSLGDVMSRDKYVQGLMVGDGEEGPALRELAKSLKVADRIHFVRSDIDTHKFLAIMDIFVFPSVKEGLGIALLEALASGKCCIASDVGGIGNIIENGSNGFLVPVGDVKAISETVSALLEDDLLRQKMGENGRMLVRERFSLDSMAKKMMSLYREVVGRRL